MKTLIASILIAILVTISLSAVADVHVNGYYRSDGTYVRPHYRSSPNSTTLDNWSTRGNVNPYTGKPGTRDPYRGNSNSFYGNGLYDGKSLLGD